MASENVHACSICGELRSGAGNDAKPVTHGSCCDDCNEKYVIPVRLEEELRRRTRIRATAMAAIALRPLE